MTAAHPATLAAMAAMGMLAFLDGGGEVTGSDVFGSVVGGLVVGEVVLGCVVTGAVVAALHVTVIADADWTPARHPAIPKKN